MSAEELFDLRFAAGLSQTDLARALDVSIATVSRWESGTFAISDERAAEIRAVCKPAVAWQWQDAL